MRRRGLQLVELTGWAALLVPLTVAVALALQGPGLPPGGGTTVAQAEHLRTALVELVRATDEARAAGDPALIDDAATLLGDRRARLDLDRAATGDPAVAPALAAFDAASAALVATARDYARGAEPVGAGGHPYVAANAALDELVAALAGRVDAAIVESGWQNRHAWVALLLVAAVAAAASLGAATWLRRGAEQQQAQLHGRWRLVSRLMTDLYFETDAAGRLVAVSEAARPLLGRAPGAMIGRPLADFILPGGDPLRAGATAEPAARAVDWLAADGSPVRLEVRLAPGVDAPAGATGMRGFACAPGSDRETQEALRESEERFRRLLDASQNGVMLVAGDGSLLVHNEALRGMLGYSAEEMDAVSVAHLVAASDLDRIMALLAIRLWSDVAPGRDEIQLVRRDGEPLEVEISTSPFRDGGRNTAVLVEVRDVTDYRRASETIRRLADYDTLTGLPNRAQFERHLQRTLMEARERRHASAVLLADLDRFKLVNDTLGHASADRLLGAVAQRLTSTLSRRYVIARFGGDEFMVLVPEVEGPGSLQEVAAELQVALEQPFEHDGKYFRVTASIGAAMYPRDGETAEALIQHAASAMHVAKERGRSGFFTYDPALASGAPGRLEMEAELQRAIDEDEFLLHYQPQVDARTGEVVAVEALIRWQHPERGLLAAGEFIETLEDSGLIMEVGERVLERACAQAQRWREEGHAPVRVAVNLSARQFLHPELDGVVRGVLGRTGLAPSLLELEVTETTATLNTADARRVLERLRAIGVTTAIDDFGIGHSTLGRLREFPVSTLKIDRSFVTNLAVSADDAALVRGIIALGHALGLTVVAEGVETAAQARLLRTLGCDLGQGYYYARPAAPETIAGLLGGAERAAA